MTKTEAQEKANADFAKYTDTGPDYRDGEWINRLLRCSRRPPQDFMDRCVEEANKFYSVSNAHWIENREHWFLVGDELPKRDGTYIGDYRAEACLNLFEGLYKGYTMALGKPKPYCVRIRSVKWPPTYKDKNFVPSMHHKAYDIYPVLGKVNTEWVETREEAEKRIQLATKEFARLTNPLWDLRYEVPPPSNFEWDIEAKYSYDQSKTFHF